ncbi:SDR family NAD(P)-dependent oxidoreductase [Nocardia rhamnosiphila]|uniref:SDR family NAD(P)-dependent oxidoreductase n=1 Tax=Nocardia rhamnosiphila TaxID=426716 RepID=UPI00340B9C88
MPVAVVTGGSRGIGRAIARRLGGTGASVVVNYRTDRAAAAEVVDAIETGGGRALSVRSDVADSGQVRALFDTAELPGAVRTDGPAAAGSGRSTGSPRRSL